ncbi:DUF1631 family protein [Methylobacter sp. Wu1]|uniref:DUF1631 family protein n=1 Tax=Methylobacter sp. Wu1 TaxID=3119359 RepID=UPI002F93A04F
MAMNIRQYTDISKSTSNDAEILAKFKSIFYHYIEPLVDDCCMRIDFEFGLQSGKDREKTDYRKQLEHVQAVRRKIKQNYLLKVSDAFHFTSQKTVKNPDQKINMASASLASDAMVEESHVVASIIRDCEHSFQGQLHQMNRQLSIKMGKQVFSDRNNPASPANLAHALAEVINPLKLTTKFRVAVYKAFEDHVFSQLGFIYGELIRQIDSECEIASYDVSEIREAPEPSIASSELISRDFQLLQKKLDQWRSMYTPSAYDLIPKSESAATYEHFEIIHALEILGQLYAFEDADREIGSPLKWRVIKKLEELNFSGDIKALAKCDEDILDLAALIFGEINSDDTLTSAVKSALLQLEIPWAAIALGQYSVFTGIDNPVRRLLNDLFAAGQFLNPADHSDRLVYERIVDVIKLITRENGSGHVHWANEASDFGRYLEKQKQRVQILEDRSRQLMQNKESLELSKKVVAKTIDDSMQGKELPAVIADFLHDVWQHVLLVDHVRRNEEPELWIKSVRAMEELVVSVLPPRDNDEKKRILKFLPGTIKELRYGLDRISYDKNAQSRFFKDLAVRHIILMDSKDKKRELGSVVKASPVVEQGASIKPEVIVDEWSEQVKNMPENNWIAIDFESGRQWGKLIWKSAETENMLFVGKNGAKMLEVKVQELAEKFRQEQAAIVTLDERSIVERALSKLDRL